MKTVELKPKEIITIIDILDQLADGDELYYGYDDMEQDRNYLKKIIKKLKNYL